MNPGHRRQVMRGVFFLEFDPRYVPAIIERHWMHRVTVHRLEQGFVARFRHQPAATPLVIADQGRRHAHGMGLGYGRMHRPRQGQHRFDLGRQLIG